MRKRDEYTKQILMLFGLGEFDSSGTFRTKPSVADNERVFYTAFNVHSPFAITCEVCTHSFREILKGKNIKDSEPGTSSSASIETPNLKPPEIEMKPKQPSSAVKPLSNLKPPAINTNQSSLDDDRADKFAIYVSRFHPKTKCEDISNHIIAKTSVSDSSLFSITNLLKRRVNFKHIHFLSFKIETTDKSIYDEILNENIWGPNFKAIPFDFDLKKKPTKNTSKKNAVNSAPSNSVTKTANPKRTVSSNKRESPKLNTGKQINKPVRKSSGPTQRSKRVVPYSIPAQIPHPIPHPVAYQGAMLHPVTYQAPLMPHSNFHQWGTQIPHHRAFQSPWFQPYPHLPYY